MRRRASKMRLLAALAATWAAGVVADARIDELERLGFSDGLATLTDSNFDRLVRAPGRPYHTFVIFNAKDAAYQCALCGPFEDEIEVLANSYRIQRQAGRTGEAQPIVFARADIKQCPKIFKEYNIQHAPLFVHFEPTEAGSSLPRTQFVPGSQFAGELDAENAAGFVHGRSGLRVEIYRSPWGKIMAAVTLLLSLGATAYFARDKLSLIVDLVRGFRPLWLLAGVGCYYIAVSGILYDIIRSVPFAGVDPKSRRMVLVSSSSGTQYVAEGLLVGAFNIFCAAAVVIMAKVVPKIKNPSTRSMALLAAGVTFVFFYGQIYGWYRLKNQWYSLGRLLSTQS